MNGYLFELNADYTYISGEYKLPILFVNESECLSFSEAYEKDIFTAEELAELINSGSQSKQLVSVFQIGDFDKNGVINVIDATKIQKYIAGLESYNYCKELADFNRDGSVTIIDATEIQKYSVM